MGYYTSHRLECDDLREWPEVVKLLEQFEVIGYALDEDGRTAQCAKWYDHMEDMRRVSSAFPTVLFTLNGEGEDPGDIWVEYYLGGKIQREDARVVLADFDPSKLIEI